MAQFKSTFAAFVDAGFLKAEGTKALGEESHTTIENPSSVVKWLQGLEIPCAETLTRVYWYDATFEPDHALAAEQRKFFDSIADVPKVRLRLGHIAERRSRDRSRLRKALRLTATDIGHDPAEVLKAFENHWTFAPERQQKGVDTLLALDLVRLAGNGVYDVAVLITGDRDLAGAVQAVQELGCQVVLATPKLESTAKELRQLADEIVVVDADALRQMLPLR